MPPVGVTITFPVPPLHEIVLATDALADSKVGCVSVTVELSVHPFASVTVTLYVFAEIFVSVWFVSPVFHE